jgi:hypothetical protein
VTDTREASPEQRQHDNEGGYQPDTRMPLTNPGLVRNDGQHRLMLAQVPVAGH